ncbi:MAG: sodium-dependent transporter [Candidatus Omnitrophica bacterium]|jgi:NSS family neurotransmitter:Na+ symporter|nr:sodium-dependent transporter [Candidatus Omnitrophota bacterium]MCF7887872.1 sodium-dependent transporter [Candidatus Omnitrophota bacterium]
MSKEQLAHHRPKWKTHIGFVLATVGSAIGLGNIWRFSYLCYKNGGGAFLVPYLIALFVVGIPLIILEIGLGHKMRGSAPASFASVSKKWEWLGWWQVTFVMFGIVLYYSVIIAWCLNYFFFAFNLSWGATPDTFFTDNFLMNTGSPFKIGDIRTIILFSLAIVWFLNWVIVFKGVQNGLERASKIFMPILFILTGIIIIWGLRLEGAAEGVAVYLKPDFSQITNIKVWMDAFSQIFFTLSLGFGIMIAYASYLPKKTQIVRDSIIITGINCLFSLLAGIGVFAVLGYMSHSTSLPIKEVVSESIGLAFVAFPKAISLLPAFSNIFGILFFGSLVIAGLSSSISIIEAFTSGIVDKFHYRRKTVVSVLCITGFLGSIIFTTQAGINWLDIVDHFLTQYGLILGAIFECIVIGWFFKVNKLRGHINHYSGWKLPIFWNLCIKVISPLVLVAILISSLAEEFSQSYGGYSPVAIILIGRDWLIYTLFAALVIAFHPWRIDPRQRMLVHEHEQNKKNS